MRFYTTATATDLKTVKAQGQCIAGAWYSERGLPVEVKAIKRVQKTTDQIQWGFVVLESIFDTYLCYYKFESGALSVRHESVLNADKPEYLACPASLLKCAAPVNSFWRECSQTYTSASRLLTPDRLAGNITVFLLKPFEVRHYSEPFFVVQKSEGEWFGIDCYGDRKLLTLTHSDLIDHCPRLVDTESLRPMDSSALASDCVNTGVLIYKQDGDRAHLLGRSKTKAEIIGEQVITTPLPPFSLHGDYCFWL
ncbi:hypothetical protein ACI77O_12855 [Pseudomonas tritici]|uniref:hypothetical protein n=1 Tax=Pseudomonas tritici TaxID=2745518 RepID=UPI00387B9681